MSNHSPSVQQRDQWIKPAEQISFSHPGMKIASQVDSTSSTGATLFYFPKGAYANFDSRGGSVASIETTLLEEGGYSPWVDGIIFSGGSTMGLSASGGVRRRIFEQRLQGRKEAKFDMIPAVPGAVVYDFGGRYAPFQNQVVYPDEALGASLMDHLSENTFFAGRAGAGISTTFNKVGKRRFGGQGLAQAKKDGVLITAAVVLNPGGNVFLPNGESYADGFEIADPQVKEPAPKENTTLSIVVVDAPLGRSQLKRLAVMVHTAMARQIHPFHSPTDGDILFAVSTSGNGTDQSSWNSKVSKMGQAAAEVMASAIYQSVRSANPVKP